MVSSSWYATDGALCDWMPVFTHGYVLDFSSNPQATIQLLAIEGAPTFQGEVCQRKKDAKQSAARPALLRSARQRSRLHLHACGPESALAASVQVRAALATVPLLQDWPLGTRRRTEEGQPERAWAGRLERKGHGMGKHLA